MKKKIFKVIALFTVATVIVFAAQRNSVTDIMSEIELANVEALAYGEWDPNLGWACFFNVSDDVTSDVFFICQRCGDCYTVSATSASNSGRCWHFQ